MTITAPSSEMSKLYAHAEAGYPHEVVGILAGNRETGELVKVLPLINERADSAHNRYKVSGLTLMRAEQDLEAEGHDILGYYHSHPDHPAQYSEYDRDHALPNMSYLITSVHGGDVTNTLSWRLVEDRSSMQAEAIHIES